VKKAGKCSAHGPPRKTCQRDGCARVAVQSGLCISHGAKKKLCSVEDCPKQAIVAGMCKKHYDVTIAMDDGFRGGRGEGGGQGGHRRGLSLFGDEKIQEGILRNVGV